MRRNTIIPVVAVALGMLGLAGCASDIGDHSETLRTVDEEALTTQLLYMQPELSPYPMTAAQVDESGIDRAEAIPVVVEVFDTVAVAWFAPSGEPIIGRDTIVALWSVVERAEPTAGELEGGAPRTVTEPGSLDVFVDLGAATAVDRDEVQPSSDLPLDAVARTIIDFWDRLGSPEELAMMRVLEEAHPGCI